MRRLRHRRGTANTGAATDQREEARMERAAPLTDRRGRSRSRHNGSGHPAQEWEQGSFEHGRADLTRNRERMRAWKVRKGATGMATVGRLSADPEQTLGVCAPAQGWSPIRVGTMRLSGGRRMCDVGRSQGLRLPIAPTSPTLYALMPVRATAAPTVIRRANKDTDS